MAAPSNLDLLADRDVPAYDYVIVKATDSIRKGANAEPLVYLHPFDAARWLKDTVICDAEVRPVKSGYSKVTQLAYRFLAKDRHSDHLNLRSENLVRFLSSCAVGACAAVNYTHALAQASIRRVQVTDRGFFRSLDGAGAAAPPALSRWAVKGYDALEPPGSLWQPAPMKTPYRPRA